jgi:hypothetical protein
VPEASIRYIHEAKNDKQKASIFSAAREGRIAVLMGSTTRMGVGTNVQRGQWRCMTSTARGGPPTSPNDTDASCGS